MDANGKPVNCCYPSEVYKESPDQCIINKPKGNHPDYLIKTLKDVSDNCPLGYKSYKVTLNNKYIKCCYPSNILWENFHECKSNAVKLDRKNDTVILNKPCTAGVCDKSKPSYIDQCYWGDSTSLTCCM